MAGVRAALACLLALAAAAALTACGKGDDGAGGGGTGARRPARPVATPPAAPIARDDANARRPVLTIGTLNFPEQVLIGRLYAGALRAAGYRVRVRPTLGSDAAALQALRDGRIDAYPAYVTAALAELHAGVVRRPAAAYARERAAFARRGFTALGPTRFENAPAFAVRRATARRLGGTRISDLAGRAQRLTL